MRNRCSIKITGESGQGIDVAGSILQQSIMLSGYHTFGYREYPSLIKGGHSGFQIDISSSPIQSSKQNADLVVCLSRKLVHEYLPTVSPGGLLIHNLDRMAFSVTEQELITNNALRVVYIDTKQLLAKLGNALFVNMFFVGIAAKAVNVSIEVLSSVVTKQFAHKPEILQSDLEAINAGYAYQLEEAVPQALKFEVSASSLDKRSVITGNQALAKGAIAAQVRNYFGYPMTPSSSILSYLADTQSESGMQVSQVEDEISAAQMTLGSMFVGTRALTATSGGGFDLMTETLSLAGITETPFVVVLAQRPGPATGMPTWTAAGDLNLAIYAGHGEFPRCVLAVSDPISAYQLIQEAFNIAEELQIVVVVLTEKQIAESTYSINNLPQPVALKRGLVPDYELANLNSSDRFKTTANGVSPRWLPGQNAPTYLANSDEHTPDGSATEDPVIAKQMMDKRWQKMATLSSKIPAATLIGKQTASKVIVGYGSTKGPVLDYLDQKADADVAYLHYDYLYPLITKPIDDLLAAGTQLIFLENNMTAQLSKLVCQYTSLSESDFDSGKHSRFLKYDGRPFFIDDIYELFRV